MSFSLETSQSHKTLIGALLALVFLGICLRFNHIADNDFVFYDEGFYLNYNRNFGEFIDGFHASDMGEMMKAVQTHIKLSLNSGKALWFMIVDARNFFGLHEFWAFSRVASAIFGCLTIGLTYQFAQRYFDSRLMGLLSAAILAVMPSHVFYSRIGLQEACSTFLVLAGFYFYLFPRKFTWRTFLGGVLMGAAFFANYRLIILPGLVLFTELVLSVAADRWPNIRKYIWFSLAFFSCVFLIGNIDDGRNTRIIFAWILHQENLAHAQFSPVNLLSYPYYLFRLENLFLGLFFLGNIFLAVRGKWYYLLPFLLVCVQMGIFSFTSDKAARYLCAVTPFIAMATAFFIGYLYAFFSAERWRAGFIAVAVIMALGLTGKSYALSRSHTNYRQATEFLMSQNANVRFLSTQNFIQNLYTPKTKNVLPCPVNFSALAVWRSRGYEYLVLDPQAYVSMTDQDLRFNPHLIGYLEFLKNNVKPVKTFPHFNQLLLERFVFEHSANLVQSVKFLNIARQEDLGQLRIYDLSQAINRMMSAAAQYQSVKE